MKLTSVVFVLMLASPAGATTLRQYTPGGSPCAGVCTYEWAREQFDVPEGIPYRMTIPAGSIVSQMSYGKNGKPYAIPDSAILMEDEPGLGYFFVRDGITFMMVQLDACENWAVMTPPVAELDYTSDESIPYTSINDSPGIPIDGNDWPGGGCLSCGGGGGGGYSGPPSDEPPPCIDCGPVEPPEVPLPFSALFMLSALLGLFAIKRKLA